MTNVRCTAPRLTTVAVVAMAQAVVSCVKLLCERLSFVEPPAISEAVLNLRRACRTASSADLMASARDLVSPLTPSHPHTFTCHSHLHLIIVTHTFTCHSSM